MVDGNTFENVEDNVEEDVAEAVFVDEKERKVSNILDLLQIPALLIISYLVLTYNGDLYPATEYKLVTYMNMFFWFIYGMLVGASIKRNYQAFMRKEKFTLKEKVKIFNEWFLWATFAYMSFQGMNLMLLGIFIIVGFLFIYAILMLILGFSITSYKIPK